MKIEQPELADWYLASSNPMPLSFLKYQLVIYMKGGKKYLKSFNILFREKRIKKFYLEKMVMIDETTDIQCIIKNVLTSEMLPELQTNTKTSKAQNTKRPRPNAEARAKSASNLFNQMGL